MSNNFFKRWLAWAILAAIFSGVVWTAVIWMVIQLALYVTHSQ